jgi:hypothetical protein
MTLITFQDGTVVFRGENVGTEQACCCGCTCSDFDADNYCHDVTFTNVGNVSTGVKQATGGEFQSDDFHIVFTFSCNPDTGEISLIAYWAGFFSLDCPTGLLFIKTLPCGVSPVGTHSLTLVDVCPAGCVCGTISWTVAEAPC